MDEASIKQNVLSQTDLFADRVLRRLADSVSESAACNGLHPCSCITAWFADSVSDSSKLADSGGRTRNHSNEPHAPTGLRNSFPCGHLKSILSGLAHHSME